MVVDSSVWIELLRLGPLKAKCEKAMRGHRIRIPALVIFEVYKKLKTKVSEETALEAVASLSQNEILNLDREIALLAGDLAIEYGLPMADSIVLAHARQINDTLLTLDNDFSSLNGVTVIH